MKIKELPMDETSTPYFFQYTFFAGKEYSTLINATLKFDYDSWLLAKIDELVAKTPELPDKTIAEILKKASVC